MITFRRLFIRALVPGGYVEWWDMCYQAKQEGWTLGQVELISTLAWLTNIFLILGVVLIAGLISSFLT